MQKGIFIIFFSENVPSVTVLVASGSLMPLLRASHFSTTYSHYLVPSTISAALVLISKPVHRINLIELISFKSVPKSCNGAL